jgi:hypothetical protein
MLEIAGGITRIAVGRAPRSVDRIARDAHSMKSTAWSQALTQIKAPACAL